MLLKDINEIWGIPISEIKRLGKRYKLISVCIYLFDMLLIVLSSVYMFYAGSAVNNYMFIVICASLLSVLMLNIIGNPEKCRSYIFYKKNKSLKIEVLTLYVGLYNMESILYCSNYKRLKKKDSIKDYEELMLSACREDSIFSKRIGNLLSKFTENTSDDMFEIKAKFIVRGKKYYLIGFESDEDILSS